MNRIALTACILAANVAHADVRALGDSFVLTPIPPAPGSPEGVAVHGHTVFVSTPARFGTAGTGPSKVYAFDIRSGELAREYVIEGEDLSQEHGLSGLAFDADARLYVLSTQLGVLRIDIVSGKQEIYGTAFPSFGPPALPNDIAFDDAGNAYVTDSLQGLIWRVPPGGGAPQVWFQSATIAAPFGPNGVRLSPDHTKVFFVVTGLGTPGVIYTLPLVAAPAESDLFAFATFGPFEAPDDIAFGNSGKLYVTLAGTSEIAVFSGAGAPLARLHDPLMDSPANIAFDNRTASLIAANHAAFTQDPDHFALLNVLVDDHGEPLARPTLP